MNFILVSLDGIQSHREKKVGCRSFTFPLYKYILCMRDVCFVLCLEALGFLHIIKCTSLGFEGPIISEPGVSDTSNHQILISPSSADPLRQKECPLPFFKGIPLAFGTV